MNFSTVKRIIFLPSHLFKLTGGIKKSMREILKNYMDVGEKINCNLENFELFLNQKIKNVRGTYA